VNGKFEGFDPTIHNVAKITAQTFFQSQTFGSVIGTDQLRLFRTTASSSLGAVGANEYLAHPNTNNAGDTAPEASIPTVTELMPIDADGNITVEWNGQSPPIDADDKITTRHRIIISGVGYSEEFL